MLLEPVFNSGWESRRIGVSMCRRAISDLRMSVVIILKRENNC